MAELDSLSNALLVDALCPALAMWAGGMAGADPLFSAPGANCEPPPGTDCQHSVHCPVAPLGAIGVKVLVAAGAMFRNGFYCLFANDVHFFQVNTRRITMHVGCSGLPIRPRMWTSQGQKASRRAKNRYGKGEPAR